MTTVTPPLQETAPELPPRRRGRRVALTFTAAMVVALIVVGGLALANAFGSGPAVNSLPTTVPTLGQPTTSPSPSAVETASPSPTPSATTPPPTKKPTKTSTPTGPMAAWISHVSTTDKVAFITIDDGWIRKSDALATLKELHVPVSLFLTINAIKADPDYFRALQGAGAVIEAHTINHVELKGKSYDYQKNQICGSADQLGQWYGRRPIFFRPPFGDKDDTTLRAAHDCGIHACFFWRETVNAGIVRYQIGHSVRPGDILLMHFRDTFSQDLRAAVKAIHDAGLQVALLEDYVR